jgi:hypothetical protein
MICIGIACHINNPRLKRRIGGGNNLDSIDCLLALAALESGRYQKALRKITQRRCENALKAANTTAAASTLTVTVRIMERLSLSGGVAIPTREFQDAKIKM